MPPVDRCLENNGDCDPVATCKDLHYHGNDSAMTFITLVIIMIKYLESLQLP